MRHEGAYVQQMKVLPVELTVHHGSYPDMLDGQLSGVKLRRQKAASGGPANSQAATRVNPEQASKVKSRTPTRRSYGEGRSVSGKRPSIAPGAVRRGMRSGMRGRTFAQRGRPDRVRDRCSQRLLGRRPDRESDGLIVPTKPGNAGGGKEPCFWDAFETVKEGRLA